MTLWELFKKCTKMVTLIRSSTLSKCNSIINTAFCYGEKCRLNDNKKLERCSSCNIEAGETCRYPQTMKCKKSLCQITSLRHVFVEDCSESVKMSVEISSQAESQPS